MGANKVSCLGASEARVENDNSASKLSDICSELFSIAVYLTDAPVCEGDEAKLEAYIVKEKFPSKKAEMTSFRIPEKIIDYALYALAAFIDEVLSWKKELDWMSRVQAKMYKEHAFVAGTQFYVNIDEIKKLENHKELLEIYYMCLILGYKGKYHEAVTNYHEAVIKLQEHAQEKYIIEDPIELQKYQQNLKKYQSEYQEYQECIDDLGAIINSLFTIDSGLQGEFGNRRISDNLRKSFQDNDIKISSDARIQSYAHKSWLIKDIDDSYIVRGEELKVYKVLELSPDGRIPHEIIARLRDTAKWVPFGLIAVALLITLVTFVFLEFRIDHWASSVIDQIQSFLH